ncbi:hypothetical protein HYDPIDRAFT_101652 [Hydnomerulius pinastri MD-312]|uniref:Unplaced genomic scaffold scaffold_68, whole genome shotgun sequence n=1 Tax=Hydnomerulius pinastri MD-312 TaxID=994086 RepID=A0A0C9W7T3_9AGAM|nr:hypothetical protein HYDPIDRAFT_101652 [Hydnomerulius pinastri MD-312]
MGEEMRGYIVGPMPAWKFLEKFLPVDKIPQYTSIGRPKDAFPLTLRASKEADAYLPFINEMRPFAPRLRFVDSHNLPDTKNCGTFMFQVKPDVCVYSDDYSEGCDSSTLDIPIEFKWDIAHDPFDTPFTEEDSLGIKKFIKTTNKAKDTLGQITAYAAVQLGSQYRTHAFSVLIVEDCARILRWDREGAIVTEPIEYGADPALAEFFSRYSQAPLEMRGVDTTVTVTSNAEAQVAREQLNLAPATRMLKTSVLCPDGSSVQVIFPAPTAPGLPPVGQATQACPAYDVNTKKMVFFKDSWRVDLPNVLPEGETYAKLNNAHVCNMPMCIACGDVGGSLEQQTQTVKSSSARWACPPLKTVVPHIHYRLALNIVRSKLTQFCCTRELVQAIHDASIGGSSFVY